MKKSLRTATRLGAALPTLALGVALLGTPSSGAAQVARVFLGAQLSSASKTDLGIGGRLAVVPSELPVELMGSLNLFFPKGPADFWELNADLLYRFRAPAESSVVPYVGGGINVGHFSNGEDGSTNSGLNLIGGFRFSVGSVQPFLEARGVISEPDQVMATFGVMF